MNNASLDAMPVRGSKDPRQRWRWIWWFVRSWACPKLTPEELELYGPASQLISVYPKDPLRRSIKRRLAEYKYRKKGPDPTLPF